MAKRKLKDILKDVGGNIRNAVSNVYQNTSQNISNIVQDVSNAGQWLALAPFKKGMERVLKARGVPVPKKLDELAKAFFTHVVNKNRFDEYFTVHAAAVKLGRHSAKVRNSFIEHHFEVQNLDTNHIAAATVITVANIIGAIVNWFKQRKDAQAAGKTLPPEESGAVDDYKDSLNGSGKTSDGSNAPDTDDDEEKSNVMLWGIIIGALALVVIIWLALR